MRNLIKTLFNKNTNYEEATEAVQRLTNILELKEKKDNMTEESELFYERAAAGAILRLNHIKGTYQSEEETLQIYEQLSTIAFYLDYPSKETLIGYINKKYYDL